MQGVKFDELFEENKAWDNLEKLRERNSNLLFQFKVFVVQNDLAVNFDEVHELAQSMFRVYIDFLKKKNEY